ncbi:MAG: non-homologous end-joining DNA ligase [Actinomycetota bacterium]
MSDPALPPFFKPMLATLVTDPFDSPDHLFEVKWDGVRVLAFCDSGSTRLYSRTGREVGHQYPEFRDLHERMRVENGVFDGEIVAMDPVGRPSFERLQGRINLARQSDIYRTMEKIPLDLIVFDAVFTDGSWRKDLPLEERMALVDSSLSFGERVLKSQAIETHGIALFEAARSKGLEGVVAKRKGSSYLPGRRSRDWLKIKVVQQADCVIGGWTPGLGWRQESLGALLLGMYAPEGLRYIGSVGTGFTDKTVRELRAILGDIETPQSPFCEPVPVKGARWALPKRVCEVDYREVTRAPRLRAPSFKRLREDKLPEECLLSDLLTEEKG